MNIYDFLGDDATAFMKASAQIYTDLSGSMQYVGKTQPEISINPNTEVVEWFDNVGKTQTLFVLDIDKFDLQVGFSFAQVLDEQALAIALNAELDTSNPNHNYLFLGSNPNDLAEAEWRLISQGRTGRSIALIIRRGVIIPSGEQTWGTPGSFANNPVTLRALQDVSITNTKRDIAYFMIDKRSFS